MHETEAARLRTDGRSELPPPYLTDTGFSDLVFECQHDYRLFYSRHRLLSASGPDCMFRVALEGELVKPPDKREAVTRIQLNEACGVVCDYLQWLDTSVADRKKMLSELRVAPILRLGMFGFEYEPSLFEGCAGVFALPLDASCELVQMLVDFTSRTRTSLNRYIEPWLPRVRYRSKLPAYPKEFWKACIESKAQTVDPVTIIQIIVHAGLPTPRAFMDAQIDWLTGSSSSQNWCDPAPTKMQIKCIYSALDLGFQSGDCPRLMWLKALARRALAIGSSGSAHS